MARHSRYANSISILHSKQFTFLVGADESPVIVHSGAIAALSASLERLVNSWMKEANEFVARLPEIQVVDFERVCEFAYRGDYADPKATRFADEEVDIKQDYFVLSHSIAKRNVEDHNDWLARRFVKIEWISGPCIFITRRGPRCEWLDSRQRWRLRT